MASPPDLGRRRKSAAALDKLIEEATVDCYDESEQISGFYTMLEENLGLPLETSVLGVQVTVERLDLIDVEEIVSKPGSHGSAAPFARSRADGARVRLESLEAREDRQPPAGTWKAPLPEFIEHLYFKRCGKERPDVVVSIEDRFRK
jgi:hypothetical protein